MPAALLPDPHPAEMAQRLTVFLGGDSEQVASTAIDGTASIAEISETSAPAVAGYLAECEEDCLATVPAGEEKTYGSGGSESGRRYTDISLIDAAEAESLSDMKPTVAGLDEEAPPAISAGEPAAAPITEVRRLGKSAKRGGRVLARNSDSPELMKKSVASASSALFVLAQPPSKSKVRLAQVDLFTSYLIGPR
jgi:hypothetical protein